MTRESAHVAALRAALGSSLAEYRERNGLNKRELAERLYYARTSISKIEAGQQSAPRTFWCAADRVLCGPIWLGDNSSEMKKVIERLYACSHLLNDAGQYAYYGRVGGCLITGNEDGVKHCAMNVLYSLQHLGYTVPPQADAGWIGEAGPGPSYLDAGSGGPDNDFTNRNTTFMTWNLMHLARMLKDAGGIPAHGNQRSEWDAGCRFDFENPEYR